MRQLFLTAIMLAIPSASLRAQGISGQSPSFFVVSKVDTAKGTIEHMATVIRHVAVTREQEVVEGGVVRKVPTTEFVAKFTTEAHMINLREAKVFDTKGRLVPVGEALIKIKAGQTVALSADG